MSTTTRQQTDEHTTFYVDVPSMQYKNAKIIFKQAIITEFEVLQALKEDSNVILRIKNKATLNSFVEAAQLYLPKILPHDENARKLFDAIIDADLQMIAEEDVIDKEKHLPHFLLWAHFIEDEKRDAYIKEISSESSTLQTGDGRPVTTKGILISFVGEFLATASINWIIKQLNNEHVVLIARESLKEVIASLKRYGQ